MRLHDITKNGSPSGNWTEVDCEWIDEIVDLQNGFYWRHRSASNVVFIYFFICTFGALANLLVIASFVRTPRLRNMRNYFIVNLAISDLLLCLVTAPVTVYFTINFYWPFGTFACRATGAFQAINFMVSCFTLVLIATDRFLMTSCPIKWRLAAKAPVACYLGVWLMAVLVTAPYFFAMTAEDTQFEPWNHKYMPPILEYCKKSKPQVCVEADWERLPFTRQTYTLAVLGMQYVLPLAALLISYTQIGSTIRRRAKNSTVIDIAKRQSLIQRNRRAMLLLSLLVLIYGIAWLPINAYNVLTVLDIIEFSQSKYIVCHMIGMASACLNPIMYGLINESFRNAFINMLQPLLRLFGIKCVAVNDVNPTVRTTVVGKRTLINGINQTDRGDYSLTKYDSGVQRACHQSPPLSLTANNFSYSGPPPYSGSGSDEVVRLADHQDGDQYC